MPLYFLHELTHKQLRPVHFLASGAVATATAVEAGITMTQLQGSSSGDLIERTARKNYDCDGDGSASHRHAPTCPKVICAGERYVECFWESPAYSSGSRKSLACAKAFYGWDK